VSRARSDREQLLADAFVGLADTLVDDYDVIDVLDRLVGYSVTLLAADAAGIMLVDSRGRLRVVASSSEQRATVAALLTRISMPPWRAMTSRMTWRLASTSRRSPATASTSRPADRIDFAVDSALARSGPWTTTDAPRLRKCDAMPFPIPDVEPVTSAILSLSEGIAR